MKKAFFCIDKREKKCYNTNYINVLCNGASAPLMKKIYF